MHYIFAYLAVGFLFLFNISESRSAPTHGGGFLTRGTGGDRSNIQNESIRNGVVWNDDILSSRILNLPEEEHDELSFENKLNSNENDKELLGSLGNQIDEPHRQKELNDEQPPSRQYHMNLANMATILSNPENLESDIEIGIPIQMLQNDLWDILGKKYHENTGGELRGQQMNNRNFHQRFRPGHTLLPQFTEKMDSYPLIKRSPDCLRKCLKQGLLHPGQCHSLC